MSKIPIPILGVLAMLVVGGILCAASGDYPMAFVASCGFICTVVVVKMLP